MTIAVTVDIAEPEVAVAFDLNSFVAEATMEIAEPEIAVILDLNSFPNSTGEVTIEIAEPEVALTLDVSAFANPISEATMEIAEPEIALTLDLNSFAGANSLSSYTHTQSSASDTWIINHNLGFKPSIQLFSVGSQLITGSVTHMSNTQTNVYFSIPVAGFARLN